MLSTGNIVAIECAQLSGRYARKIARAALMSLFCYRCRTCRKRKTRCDGKKPLCSTCLENGHECLGYVEEGSAKKERKEGDSSFKRENNDDDDMNEDNERTPIESDQKWAL